MFKIKDEEKDGVIYHTLTGQLDCAAGTRHVLDNIKSWDGKSSIYDFRGCSLAEVNLDEWRAVLPALKAETEFRRGLKAACVTDSDLQFGMLRMLEIIGELQDFPLTIRCFRDLDSALDWVRKPQSS